MRIAILGVGGVGGYFGGRLAQAGEAVFFIARGEHLQAMQAHGLRVESLQGDFQVFPVQATADPGEIGIVDVVLLGVKTWQVEAARATVAGYTIGQVGVHHYPRTAGDQTGANIKVILRAFKELFKLRRQILSTTHRKTDNAPAHTAAQHA